MTQECRAGALTFPFLHFRCVLFTKWANLSVINLCKCDEDKKRGVDTAIASIPSPKLERKRQLNVISLEFSFTKMEPMVVAPRVVRQVDWTNHVWPRHLKENQTEGTNDLRDMWYPKGLANARIFLSF